MWHAALSLVTVSHVISLSSAGSVGLSGTAGCLPDPLIGGDSHQQPTEPSLKHSISSIVGALRRGTLALYDALIISPIPGFTVPDWPTRFKLGHIDGTTDF